MSRYQADYKIDGRPSTIFKVVHDKDNPYVMINKALVENPALSFKAKGIMAYLMSRPDGWEVSVTDLINRSTDGRDAVRSGLKELRDAGHMQQFTEREAGKFAGCRIEVYELPICGPVDPHPITTEIEDEEQP